MLLFSCGLILETNVRHFREQFEHYVNDFESRERLAEGASGLVGPVAESRSVARAAVQ